MKPTNKRIAPFILLLTFALSGCQETTAKAYPLFKVENTWLAGNIATYRLFPEQGRVVRIAKKQDPSVVKGCAIADKDNWRCPTAGGDEYFGFRDGLFYYDPPMDGLKYVSAWQWCYWWARYRIEGLF